MPVLFVDDKPIPQSFAIVRYVASLHGKSIFFFGIFYKHRISEILLDLLIVGCILKHIWEYRTSKLNIALTAGLAGKTSFEAAWVDAIGDQWKDFQSEFKKFLFPKLGYGEGDLVQCTIVSIICVIPKMYFG